MGQLDGKTALVTGASSGIGFAAARRFIAEGARVFLTGRRQEALAAAADQLGQRAVPIVGDISDPADLDRLFGEVSTTGAGLDVVFANAGIGELATIDDIDPARMRHIFAVNVGGTVFTVQKSLPLLNAGATIVVNGSSSAYRGTPGFGVYSATKAALRQFVRVWAGRARTARFPGEHRHSRPDRHRGTTRGRARRCHGPPRDDDGAGVGSAAPRKSPLPCCFCRQRSPVS